MSDDTEDILNEFIQESRDHLAAIEPDLLELERQGEKASPEVVNRIFRAIHSTKGGASFLAFDALKRFSHAMENVLMLVRDGQLLPTTPVVDVLLRGIDLLRLMLDDIGNSDQVPCERELAELKAMIQKTPGEAPVAAPAPSPAAALAPSPAAAPEVKSNKAAEVMPSDLRKEIIATGKRVFQIRAGIREGNKVQNSTVEELVAAVDSVGQCLKVTREGAGNDEQLVLLCATVLEKDLLAAAAKIPVSAISSVEVERTKPAAAPAPPAVVPPVAIPAPPAVSIRVEAAPVAAPPTELGLVDKALQRSSGNEGPETLRVKVDLLTRLMNVAGELVLGRNQLLRSLRESADGIPGLVAILQHVDRVTTELQEGIMQTRMQPVNTLFARYTRMARDLGRQLNKRIELETSGNEVELDKSIIEALADPLTHVIRNAIDHGIELPDERSRQGKPIAGHIRIAAFHESGQVYIVVADDGRGINRAKVRKKALERHLVTQAEAANLTDREIMNLLLLPGFSTAEQVTDLSGRGVGMDVVRTNVEKLGGHVELDSVEGKGTTVRLRLPLTLAIIPSLVVRVGDARYAVPQVNIVELVWIRSAEIEERVELVQGAPLLRLRGKLLPLVHLGRLMNIGDRHAAEGDVEAQTNDVHVASLAREYLDDPSVDLSVVVLRSGDMRFGILVDELYEWEEIVVKPVPTHLMDIGAFAGTTILGDGRVIMILDPGGIAKLAELSMASGVSDDNRRVASEESRSDSRSVILFSNAPGELFAVPQDRVLRLERIEPKQLEHVGGRSYVKYRGQGLPVIKMDAHYPVSPVPTDADELYLIIPKDEASARNAEPEGGILVWKILDALDVSVSLSRPLFSGPGIIGSAVVDGTLTMFMDPAKLLSSVRELLGAA